MHFMIHTLRIIIFAILISNIVTKPDNSSIWFDEHIELDTKKNIYDNTSGNNIHVTKKKDDNQHDSNEPIGVWICLFFLIIAIIILYLRIYIDCRCRYSRQCIGRICPCCHLYIRRRDINPEPGAHQEANNYQDEYEIQNIPIEHV